MAHNHQVTGRWNDEKCDEKRSWVCYRKKCEGFFVVVLFSNVFSYLLNFFTLSSIIFAHIVVPQPAIFLLLLPRAVPVTQTTSPGIRTAISWCRSRSRGTRHRPLVRRREETWPAWIWAMTRPSSQQRCSRIKRTHGSDSDAKYTRRLILLVKINK